RAHRWPTISCSSCLSRHDIRAMRWNSTGKGTFVLVLFQKSTRVVPMARSSATALRRPPAPMPSTPAGDLAHAAVHRDRRRGRGAISNVTGRYEPLARVAFDDGWQGLEELPPFKTTVSIDATRKIITRNDSPDISFDRSINPYRGCEHGCVYCFARPTHAYL